MAVPKKRTSKSKTRTRKAAWFAKAWQKSMATMNVYRLMSTLNQKPNRATVGKAQNRIKTQGFGIAVNPPLVRKSTRKS